MFKLKGSGTYTINNSIGDNINKYYEMNEDKFIILENIFFDDFSVPHYITRDYIKYILSLSVENDVKNQDKEFMYLHYYKQTKMFIFFIITMIYFLINSILGSNRKKNTKTDILYEYGYEHIYRIIFKKLNKFNVAVICFSNIENKINDLYQNVKNIFNTKSTRNTKFLKSTSWRIFKKQIFRYLSYDRLSRELEFDIVTLSLRILKHMAAFESDMNGISSKVLITANCNGYTSLRYYIYKKYINNLIIIENGINIKSARCDGLWFIYSDYYIEMGKSNKIDMGMNCKNIKPMGSLTLANNLYDIKSKNIKLDIIYDIVFMEQYIIKNSDNFDTDYYIKILNYLAEFSNKYPQYKILYRARNSRDFKHSVSVQEYVNKYDEIIKSSNIILDDKISSNSYESILKSKVVVFYASSIGVEALAMNKKVLCVNFNKKHFCKFTEEDSICMLYENSYDKFEEKLNYLLCNDNSGIVEFYKKIKALNINQSDNIINDICKIVKKEIAGDGNAV